MTDETGRDEDDIAHAGEYALRLMDSDARLAFERRLEREHVLRDLVRQWDDRLAPLTDEIPPEAPPRHIKKSIEATIFDERTPARRTGRLWFVVFGGALAAAALAVAVFFYVLPSAPTPNLTAEIAADDRSLVFSARFDASSGMLEVERLEGTLAPGRVHELWLISENAPAPVSLGVLPDAARVSLDLSDNLVSVLEGGTLAVSDEPPGGSPTGQPTGAVLAVGPVDAG